LVPKSYRNGPVLRFGVFEADLHARELRKHGVRLNIQNQSFLVLAAFLERPGEIISREELYQQLWPDQTFVDFEHNLNAVVKKLRAVLAESAESPRFIETLARRGYRFVAPVVEVEGTTEITKDQGTAPKRLTRDSDFEQATPVGQIFTNQQRISSLLNRFPSSLLKWTAIGVICSALIIGSVLWKSPEASPRLLRAVQLTNDRRPKGDWIATDGLRVYFSELIDDHFTLVRGSLAGAETVIIPTPLKDVMGVDISPDASDLLVVAGTDRSLWSMPVLGGSPRRLGGINALEATWSPDGEKILYANGRDLYVARGDGTEPRKLATVGDDPYFLRWSPDGTRISLSLAGTLWEIAADGTNLHLKIPGWGHPLDGCSGHWTPDGKYLIFDSYRGGTDNIWIIREKGSLFRSVSHDPMRLTTGPMHTGRPALSRDGKKIFAKGWQDRGELVRYDSKSGFVPYLSGISVQGVTFSRDGEWITYVAYPEGTLWRSKVDASERLQLSFTPLQAVQPRWSPDGKRIVFAASIPGTPWQIYITSAEGGSPQQLTADDRNHGDPSWSPDGKSLMFGVERDGKTAISLLDTSTHRLSTLPNSEGLCCPHWSPDGRYVAAPSSDGQTLRLFEFKTATWSEWAKTPVEHENWSRDGKFLYFSTSGVESAFYRLRVNAHTPERVVSLRGIGRQALGPFGSSWTGLAPDDSPLALRDIGVQEIYALDWQAP
jgi:Tol biopolymer transport system component/DNA-binding winged helix-turn-helix (wHTH) protein